MYRPAIAEGLVIPLEPILPYYYLRKAAHSRSRVQIETARVPCGRRMVRWLEMASAALPSVWAEWKELMRRSGLRGGGSKSLLIYAIIGAFGILVPWYRGIEFFDSFLMFAYSAIALLLAASAMSGLMASGGGPERSPNRVVASSLNSWMVFLVIVILGIATVNITSKFHAAVLLHPPWAVVATTLSFAFCGSLLLSALAAVLSVVFNPAVARNSIRALFLLTLISMLYLPRLLPPIWRVKLNQQMTTAGLTRLGYITSAVALALAVALIVTLRRGLAERRSIVA